MKLYHLSKDPKLGVLTPRVPKNALTKSGQEDNITKRVCFAPSIYSALVAAPPSEMGAVLYIYEPVSFNKKFVYKPTPFEVPTVSFTHELWYLAPVTVKKVGALVIGDEIKHKLIKHPKFPELEGELTWFNYKRFKEKPTRQEVNEYLKTQQKYQQYLKDYRTGILQGAIGSLAGLAVFVLLGKGIKRIH